MTPETEAENANTQEPQEESTNVQEGQEQTCSNSQSSNIKHHVKQYAVMQILQSCKTLVETMKNAVNTLSVLLTTKNKNTEEDDCDFYCKMLATRLRLRLRLCIREIQRVLQLILSLMIHQIIHCFLKLLSLATSSWFVTGSTTFCCSSFILMVGPSSGYLMLLHETKLINRRLKRVKKGSGVINTLINKLPFELHIPGYQYCGPGIKLAKRLARGDPGINKLDQSCREHDIAYNQNLEDRHNADYRLEQQAWERVKSKDASIGDKSAVWAITNTMKAKKK
ncbi:hypothetical protein NQ315_011313 [Exocentrus adspersus]|uniref:Phospholipase A2-like domain-containing protein n=1 Tax=Exocentrus adspersus TaxID=1586481 RepID=A0AAV8VJ06_9CUCU|nr:hypothetical protein NQ315_011313 [Exocentrus adspersus]